MGIPSYFSYIIKKYPDVLNVIQNYEDIDNLYLDCNSIIYDSTRKIDYICKEEYEKTLIHEICKKILNVYPSNIEIQNELIK